MTSMQWTLAWHDIEWLWLTLIPPLLLLVLRMRRAHHQRSLTSLADAHLLPLLLRGSSFKVERDMVFTVACMCAAIAAAGPYLSQSNSETPRHGLDIALVIDISPSMNATDIPPSRLARARLAAHDVLMSLRMDRYGVVAFSAHAYSVLPLTADKALVRDVINALDTQLATRKGSALDSALERAMNLLSTSPQDSRAIVLLSDGEHHSERINIVTSRLIDARIPVFSIGMGTAQGAPITDENGFLIEQNGVPVISALSSAVLEKLAQDTHGAYRNGEEPLLTTWLQNQLSGLTRQVQHDVAMPGDRSLAAWPLLTGIVLLLWWYRTQFALLATLSAGVMLAPWPDAYAAPWDEYAALNALQRGEWNEAAEHYRDETSYNAMLGRGVIAYRQHNFVVARDNFMSAARMATAPEQQARAHYNLGNTYARLKQLDAAEAAFQSALQAQPNYPRAALNLSLVSQERKRFTNTKRDRDGDNAALPRGTQTAEVTNPQRPTAPEAAKSQPIQIQTSPLQKNNDQARNSQPWLPENTRTWLEKRFTQLDQTLGGGEGGKPW